jgi:hypothetical protein
MSKRDFVRTPHRINLTKRTRRTPYYMTDLPPKVVAYLTYLRTLFVETFNREYESSDPQFWDDNFRDYPREQPTMEAFLRNTAEAMRLSNHHPAHIYAFEKTHKIIYGCGTCIDECDRCNFRSVPDDWTIEWQKATQEYEKWEPGRLSKAPQFAKPDVRWR